MRHFKFFFFLLFLTGCGNESDVKKTPYFACPDKTVDQVFKKNYTNHNWSSFSKDKKDFVKYEGIVTSKKGEKTPVIFLFGKNQLNSWSPIQVLVAGGDVTPMVLHFSDIKMEMCSK